MAHLFYGGSQEPIDMPDRVLAHFKVIAAMKLRRNEAFTVSWHSGTGRETLWMQPSIPLRFVFNTAEPELLDRAILADMSTMANASSGLMLTWDAAGDPVTPNSSPAVDAVETGASKTVGGARTAKTAR